MVTTTCDEEKNTDCYETYYEESVVVRIKSNLLLLIFWFYMFDYNS